MDFLDLLHAQLRVDEGVRPRPYPDQMGKVTIGVGRNLTDKGLNRGEIALCFDNDLADAEHAARTLVKNFDALNDARKAAVVNMAFQLGLAGLAQFPNTLRAIQEARWADAAEAMLSSKVATTQAPARWARLAQSMRSGA